MVAMFEVESHVRRLEEVIREAHIKRAAAARVQAAKRVHVVLVLPPTRHHRTLVAAHRTTFDTAFPRASSLLQRALRSADAPWPGDGVLWLGVAGGTPA
jgi:hypothetical protein